MLSPWANAADGPFGVSNASTRAHTLGEVAQDQRPHLLRAQVIRIELATDSTDVPIRTRRLTSAPSPRYSRALVKVAQVPPILAQAEAHAVVRRWVGRCLARRATTVYVVRPYFVCGSETSRSLLSCPQPAKALLPQTVDVLRYPVHPVFARHADPQPSHMAPALLLRNPLPERWHRRCSSDSCPAIDPSKMAQSADRANVWSWYGRARRANAMTPQREHRPGGRLQAHDAAERRGLAEGSAGVGAGRTQCQARRHGCGRATGRAARNLGPPS